MTEVEIKSQSQKCILFRSPDRMLTYSTFQTDIESQKIQELMIQQGFVVISAMFVPDAIRAITKETCMNTNFPESIQR